MLWVAVPGHHPSPTEHKTSTHDHGVQEIKAGVGDASKLGLHLDSTSAALIRGVHVDSYPNRLVSTCLAHARGRPAFLRFSLTTKITISLYMHVGSWRQW